MKVHKQYRVPFDVKQQKKNLKKKNKCLNKISQKIGCKQIVNFNHLNYHPQHMKKLIKRSQMKIENYHFIKHKMELFIMDNGKMDNRLVMDK